MKFLYKARKSAALMWPFRFAMQRRTKRGLPHMVIYLLSSGPKNGVELMDGVQNITRGWWRPTPGSIYPLLKEMTDQGMVIKKDDGRYELTSKGREEAHEAFGPHRQPRGPRTTGDMVALMDGFVSYMEDLKGTASEELEPHKAALKELANRISALVGDKEGKTQG
jgi:DNA-binding PadR family transcriptional regulator